MLAELAFCHGIDHWCLKCSHPEDLKDDGTSLDLLPCVSPALAIVSSELRECLFFHFLTPSQLIFAYMALMSSREMQIGSTDGLWISMYVCSLQASFGRRIRNTAVHLCVLNRMKNTEWFDNILDVVALLMSMISWLKMSQAATWPFSQTLNG